MSEGNRAFPVLYVDDEPQNLLTFRYALEDQFTVLTAPNGQEAMRVLESEEVAVLMCDQRMPEMTGVEVCRRAREIKPEVVRIMVTAYADVQATVDAINHGQVLRYVTKPWRNDELVEVLKSSIEMVRLRRMVHEMQARVLRGGHPPMVEALVRQIASELHTPLSMLTMNSEHASDLLTAGLTSWRSPDRAKELVQAAEGAIRDSSPPLAQLEEIMHRLKRGQRHLAIPQPVFSDAVRVVQATARIVGPTLHSNVRLQLVFDSSPAVQMEAAELGQVLIHLITNAAQALEGMLDPDRTVITVHVAESQSGTEIIVADRGPGIPATHLERIFDPYVTTREGAPGLGLAMVRHLVVQAGGEVWAESDVGQGSRIVVQLPRAS